MRDKLIFDLYSGTGTIEEKPDLIVPEPPRDGIHPKALSQIIDYGVGHMVYISCKPSNYLVFQYQEAIRIRI